MPSLNLSLLFLLSNVPLSAGWHSPSSTLAAADVCQKDDGEAESTDYGVHMLQAHARAEGHHPDSCHYKPCQLEGCCPKTKTDCITHPNQVEEIFKYILSSGQGSACTDYVEKFLSPSHGGGEKVTADDLCVSGSLVFNMQIIMKGDPGNCLDTMSTPTALAPQLGCSPWTWFSDATGILSFLKAIYQQLDAGKLLAGLLDVVDASINPAPTEAFPPKWAKVRIFDRTSVGVPKLIRPNPSALVQGPSLDTNTYGPSRDADPFPPVALLRGGLDRPWWKGAEFLMTDCKPGLDNAVCSAAKTVLSGVSLAASRALLTQNFAEITGCPWTRPARGEPGKEYHGPQKTDAFKFAEDIGTYSCTGGLKEIWTCLVCPKKSKCIGPDADDVANGWEGCGLAEANKCYPVSWFGNLRDRGWPTPGCYQWWLDDMRFWLAAPRRHLNTLSKKEPGTVTAVEALNTLIFVFDSLATGGHSGWRTRGGLVNTDANGNPTCSTTGANQKAGTPDGAEACGGAETLPCCSPTAKSGEQFVEFAGAGAITTEWVTMNVKSPESTYLCMTAFDICGPTGPTVDLADGVSAILECSPGA